MAAGYYLNVHAIPMFVIGEATLALGYLVFRSNRQSAAHRHFLMLCGSIALWLNATGLGLCAETADLALAWFRVDNVGVMFISVAFYAFSSEFLCLERRRSIWLGYASASVMALAVLLHEHFIIGVRQYWWGYFPQWGSASLPFFVLFFSYMAVAFNDYYRSYRSIKTPIKRQQVKFVLAAFIIAYTASIDFVPAFGFEIYPFGYIPIFLLTVVITVAILQYRLLDAAVVVSHSATYLPLIPFTVLLVFFAHILAPLPPVTISLLLVMATIAFIAVYVTVQPRLQAALNKMLFPSRYDAYATLTRFCHAMVTNLDLANLQDEIVKTLQLVMGIEKVSLFVFDKEQGRYVIKGSQGMDRAEAGVTIASNAVFATFLLERKQPIVKEELEQRIAGAGEQSSATIIHTMTQLGSEVCLPLVNKKVLIGFVNLGHKSEVELYSQAELSLLHSLSDNAAIALDNALLHEDWKRSQALLRRADRLRSLETIAGGFAHEVRNPLTSIKTFIQLAPSRRNDTEFMDQFGAVVMDDLARIERLIEEILDYARYMKPRFSPESLNEILTTCLHFMQVKADRLGISVEKQLADDMPTVLIDRQQIKQVILNLAMNALDAMGKGGGLTVSSRRVMHLDNSRWIQLEVADTGCGIPPEDLQHIFDPFFTTKHESTEHVGTGLGLSIVHQIIQEHGGTVEVRSTVGEGTTFTITLPEERTVEVKPEPSSNDWQGTLTGFPEAYTKLFGRGFGAQAPNVFGNFK